MQESISIQNADLPFFQRTGYRVEVFQGSNLYMKISKIPINQVQQDQCLKNLSKREMEKEYFFYDELKLVRRKQLYIPPAFLENTSMYRGDHFTLKKVDDDTMLVIPKLQKDEITNEFFDPFEKKRKIVTLKQEENEGIKSIQRIQNQTKLDLAGMLKEMRKINNRI